MDDYVEPLWLGIDLGTTSVKIVVTNIHGNVISCSSCSSDAKVESSIGSLGYEQNPLKILSTVHSLVVPLLTKHGGNVKGVGVTGQMHGVVMWGRDQTNPPRLTSLEDAGSTFCSNLYTWQDQRCSPDYLKTLPAPSSPHQPLSTGHGCATIFWLVQNQPSIIKDNQFSCCGTIMDLLVWMLCGLKHPVTSDQLAASLGYFNASELSWDSVLKENNEFPDYLLPHIVPAGSVIGKVCPSLAGWPAEVPVVVGMGDVQCAMHACLQNPGDAAVNIGTSVQLGFIIPAEDGDSVRKESPPSLSFFPYFDGQLLALSAGLNGGNAIGHFIRSITEWMKELGMCETVDETLLLNRLQKQAEKLQDESSTLRVRPVFFGERHDTSLSGSIQGINATNFSSAASVFKAVCEGMVDHLCDMVPAKYLITRGISRLLLSGSVAIGNPLVRQRLYQKYELGTDLVVSIDNESTDAAVSAIGAAKIASSSQANVNILLT